MFASFLSELNVTSILFRNQYTSRSRYEPTLLNTHTDVKLEWIQIECGGGYTIGLTKNGQVFSWGRNFSGVLGHGDKKHRTIPTKVEALDGIVIIKISCGKYHTAAISNKEDILTWYVRS
jgi:alpha-tubulin suppressor-like RCC1 family protein